MAKKWTEEVINEKLIECISTQLGVEKQIITNDASISDDLGADSLDNVELIMQVEEDFGISIPEEDAETIRTVGDYKNYLINKLLNKDIV